MRYVVAMAVILAVSSGVLLGAVEEASRVGYVMPVACKSRSPEEGGPEEHTTRCALEPDCVETGFGLLSEGEFLTFDAKGNELALRYFKTTKKLDQHKVEVVGDIRGEEVQVKEIKPLE